jgi:protein-S-isoprenylcysteine O-methyltransferase Ste14
VSRGVQRWRVPLGFVAAAILIVAARPHWLSLLIGLPLALAGLAVRAAAAGHIRKNEVLATTGPYRFTRNPLYFGSIILGFGLVVAAASWLLALLALGLLVGVYLPVIRREEQYLASRFGADFDLYAARVPRLWPRWPTDATGGHSFSLALYLKHREYQALLGFVAIAVVLIAKWLVPALTPNLSGAWTGW